MAGNPLQVILLYNEPRVAPANGKDVCPESEEAVLDDVYSIENALKTLGIRHRIVPVRRLTDIPGAICSGNEPVIFNIAESLDGDPRDVNSVPAVCRSLGRDCTGGDSWCLDLTMNKRATKAMLTAANVAVPQGMVLFEKGEPDGRKLPPFPVIVKPLNLDASEGIEAGSVIMKDENEVYKAARLIHERFQEPALVERYIDGREINVAMMEDNGELITLPVAEIDFSAYPVDKPRIVCYSAKWVSDSFEYKHTPRKVPADIPPELNEEVRQVAIRAWKAACCRDYARIDMRLDKSNACYVLEVNANPDISPDAGFQAALRAAGVPFESFVEKMVKNAYRRYEALVKETSVQVASPAEGEVSIRKSDSADRAAILRMISGMGSFRPDEIVIAAEVFDDSLAPSGEDPYESYTALVGDRVAGWISFSPVACALHAYEIDWLAVAPEYQRRRLGRKLTEHVEKTIQARGGRIIVIETSGRPEYEKSRAFYARTGYREEGRIRNFYALGDDKVIYVKDIAPSQPRK